MAKSYITLDTRIDAFKDEFNNLVNKVGDLSSLTTSASGDSDLVQAINEHSAELGTITAGAMGTTASTVSTAIAELDAEADSDRSNFANNIRTIMLDPAGTGTSREVTASANNSTNETTFITFVDGATGSQGIETDTGLTYNPSSGNLTIGGELAAATLDISGNIDIDGTTNLDAVDIDGAVQLDATLTVGVDDTGYDVKLFGDTASAFMQWDASADDLILSGAAGLIVPDGQLTLGSTALTSTAAELNLLDGVSGLVQADFTKLAAVTSSASEINLLDGVSGLVQADFTKLAAVDATATELNIMDGGTSATSTTIADADRVVVNDAGTMKQVAVTDLAAYFDDEITAMPNLVTTAATTVGVLNSGSITSGFGSIDVGSSSITTTGAISGGSVTVGGAALNEAELEILDGATVTTAELNVLDGNDTLTPASDAAITVADGDAVIMNDGGVMRQVDISLLKSYFGQVDGGTALTTIDIDGAATIGEAIVGDDIFPISNTSASGGNRRATATELRTWTNAGTLSEAAQTNITSLGTLTTLTVDNVIVNGSTIGHTSDADLMTVASNKLTVAGEVQMTTLDIGGTNVTATAAEINLIDGDATVGTTAIADGDGIIINDAGTMRVSTVQTLAAYLDDEITAMPNLVQTGALNSGSITSGFGSINNGSSAITTTGTITGGQVVVDDITIDGSTISDAGTMAFDLGGDLTIDVGGGDIRIKDDGTDKANIGVGTGILSIQNMVNDADTYFVVKDNGSNVNALILDGSEAGDATFNRTVTATTFVGALTGNASTATTATALATGRTIGMTGDVVWTSASFTGAANVTGSATIQSSAVETAMIANAAVTGAKIANDTVAEANMADDAIGSAQMKTLRTFTLKDSGGSALFTMYGAGA